MDEIKNLHVLLAEDNPLAVLGLRLLVVNLGHQVVGVARTGHEAVQQAKLHTPDLILMDIKMPGMDGIEATRLIMKERPTPVILVTAYGDEQTIRQGKQAGAVAYLSKPVSEHELRSAIQTAYRDSRSARQDQKSGVRNRKTGSSASV